MGYASHLAVKAFDASVLQSTRSDLSLALGLYYAQFGLNLLWSPLFFGSKQTGIALVDCALTAGITIYMTKLLDGLTASQTTYFLLPYCAWLSFATYLNGGIWWLNRNCSDKLE
jgi:benzodiazapine receptor